MYKLKENLVVGERYGRTRCVYTQIMHDMLAGKNLDCIYNSYGGWSLVKTSDSIDAFAVDEEMLDEVVLKIHSIDEGLDIEVDDYAELEKEYVYCGHTYNVGDIFKVKRIFRSNTSSDWDSSPYREYRVQPLHPSNASDRLRIMPSYVKKVSQNDADAYLERIAKEIEEQARKEVEVTSKLTEEKRCALIGRLARVLNEEGYNFTHEALGFIVNKWWMAKHKLVEMFENNPLWDSENFRFIFDTDWDRKIDANEVSNFLAWIREIILYSVRGKVSDEKFGEMYGLAQLCYNASGFAESATLSESLCEYITATCEEIFKDDSVPKPHEGAKVCRYINKLLGFFPEIKGHEEYEKRYARFADALSPTAVKRHTIFSLNPVDFLLMSRGNSWNSCQGIKLSEEHCSSAGVLSLALDETSIIMYTVNSDYNGSAEDIELEPKINRVLFAYDKGRLVQQRVYPQSNDADLSVYEPYRKLAQKLIADSLNKPSLWQYKGIAYDTGLLVHHSEALHYPDWRDYSRARCNLSIMKDVIGTPDAGENIVIGAPAYDVFYKGEKLTCARLLTRAMNEDDEYVEPFEDEDDEPNNDWEF